MRGFSLGLVLQSFGDMQHPSSPTPLPSFCMLIMSVAVNPLRS